MEVWKDIKGYNGYEVSSYGRIMDLFDRSGPCEVAQYINQQNHPSVVLYGEKRRRGRKSVAPLVAEAFVEFPPNFPQHDIPTPIHLNGDVADCHADNLMWRTRRFAINYHRQFKLLPLQWLNCPVHMVSTNEDFEHAIDCCMKYGLLVEQVVDMARGFTQIKPHFSNSNFYLFER